jgi:hypothetical protein
VSWTWPLLTASVVSLSFRCAARNYSLSALNLFVETRLRGNRLCGKRSRTYSREVGHTALT